MNLLEATTTVIDFVKTNAPEEDRTLARAVKRMEKRLFVLQVRSAKARRRNRSKAFWDAMGQFNGGVLCGTKICAFECKGCRFDIRFSDFCKNAEFTGSGKLINITCPKCNLVMERPA